MRAGKKYNREIAGPSPARSTQTHTAIILNSMFVGSIPTFVIIRKIAKW